MILVFLFISVGLQDKVGFNAPFFPQFIGDSEYRRRYKMELDTLAEAGIKWIRPNLAFNWDFSNPDSGTFYTEVMDSIVLWTGKRGMHIVPFVMGTPSWASDTSLKFMNDSLKSLYLKRIPPLKMKYWEDFWHFIVERYDGDGINDFPGLIIPVKQYEVWNEPRGIRYFLGSFEDYCYLYLIAMEAAISADSECIVIAPVIEGGLKSTGWALYDSKKMAVIWTFDKPLIQNHKISNWLEYIIYYLCYIKEKTGEYPLIISAHLYYADTTNNPYGRIDTLLFAHIDSLFYYLEQDNIENTEVWVTEIGRRILEPEEGNKRLEFTKYIISELLDSPYSDRIKIFFFAGLSRNHSYLERKNFEPTPAFKFIKKIMLNQEPPNNH